MQALNSSTGLARRAPCDSRRSGRRCLPTAAAVANAPGTSSSNQLNLKPEWHKLARKHVLGAEQFSKESLEVIFDEAIKVRAAGARPEG